MGQNIHHNSLPRKILNEILTSFDEAMIAGRNPSGVLWSGGADGYMEKQRFKEERWAAEERRKAQQALKRLRDQHLVRIERVGEEVFVKLTDKGMGEQIKRTVLRSTIKLARGKLCYVSYDVPEHVKEVRSALRLLLKDAEFTMMHESLWCSEKDVAEEVAMFVKSLKAERWIHVFVGEPKT